MKNIIVNSILHNNSTLVHINNIIVYILFVIIIIIDNQKTRYF